MYFEKLLLDLFSKLHRKIQLKLLYIFLCNLLYKSNSKFSKYTNSSKIRKSRFRRKKISQGKKARKFLNIFSHIPLPYYIEKNVRESESPYVTHQTPSVFFGHFFTHLTAHVLLGACLVTCYF